MVGDNSNIETYFDKLNKNVLRLILNLVPKYVIGLKGYRYPTLYIMDNLRPQNGFAIYYNNYITRCYACGHKAKIKFRANCYFEGDCKIFRQPVFMCERCFYCECSVEKNYHTLEFVKLFKIKVKEECLSK